MGPKREKSKKKDRHKSERSYATEETEGHQGRDMGPKREKSKKKDRHKSERSYATEETEGAAGDSGPRDLRIIGNVLSASVGEATASVGIGTSVSYECGSSDGEGSHSGSENTGHKRKHACDMGPKRKKNKKKDGRKSERSCATEETEGAAGDSRPIEMRDVGNVRSASVGEVTASHGIGTSVSYECGSTVGDSTDSDCAMDRPVLLDQLKTILDQYQDVQILREMVQNADDANASEMKMMYVSDTGKARPMDPNLNDCYAEYFRSHALCVYNNEVFNKTDWKYIKSIYGSGKRENCLKVGRFGLGFKSVFHMTDNPVIISGDRMMIIDPFRIKKGLGEDCQILKFKKLCKPTPGKCHYSQALSAMKSSIFGHFGFTEASLKESYQGSLFWFPLRQTPSYLSTKVFCQSDVTELINMFKKELPCLPLFLKNITDVSICDEEETRLFSVTCNVAKKLVKESFHRKLALCNGSSPDETMQALFSARLDVQDGGKVEPQNWVVCNYIKGKNVLSEELKQLTDDKELCYSPFVGLAVPVDHDASAERFQGQVFCFLPLPLTSENQTGLPLHVNGFFALSQDRHHVKWPTDDQIEREEKAQTWNRLLCEEVIVDAYTELIQFVKKVTMKCKRVECDDNLVYQVMPTQKAVRPNWSSIVNPLYRQLEHMDIFFTLNDGGKWISATDAIFFFLEWDDELLDSSIIKETEQCIFDLLLKHKRDVVKIPAHVKEMFPDASIVTPCYMRDMMRTGDVYTNIPDDNKLLLLQFIAADHRYEELENFKLVPLQNGEFSRFDGHAVPGYLLSVEEMNMFPGMEDRMVKFEIPHMLKEHLKRIQEKGLFNLKMLDGEAFPGLLETTLCRNGKGGTSGNFIPNTSCRITMDWLDNIWHYIQQQEYDTSERFKNMHLVPFKDTKGAKSAPGLELMRLKGYYMVVECEGMGRLDQTLINALLHLSLVVIQDMPKGPTFDSLMDRSYCKFPNSKGFLKLLKDVYADAELNIPLLDTRIEEFNTASTYEEKQALLHFLSTGCEGISGGPQYIISRLAVFPQTTNEGTPSTYDSIFNNRWIVCDNSIPVKYPLPLLHLSESQKLLAEQLGAEVLPSDQLVEKILQEILDKNSIYDKVCTDRFMMYFLQNFSMFQEQCSVVNLASMVEFMEVTTTEGTIKFAPVGRFFDPENEKLQTLFQFERNKFPPLKYCNNYLRPSLGKLGLKSAENLEKNDILCVVETLDNISKNNECKNPEHTSKIRNCSLQLMELMENLDEELFIRLDLKCYQWISYMDKRPVHYPHILPWFGDQCHSTLCTPAEVVSSDSLILSASVRCIVETVRYPRLAKAYRWDLPPSVNVCLSQFDVVKTVFCIQHKAKLIGHINDIYSQLYDYIKSADQTELMERLRKLDIVCTGETFHLPEEAFVAFSPEIEEINLKPYRYKIPNDFSEFNNMFVMLGAKDVLDLHAFKCILQKIKDRISTTCNNSTATNVKKDRDIVLNILKAIAELSRDADDLSDVLVPIQTNQTNLVLYPVEECTYTDKGSDWLCDDDCDDDIRYVHQGVPAELAEALGVQSFTQRFLSDGGTEEMYAAFGQSEPLTTRLKNLLENYPDGLAVVKELVQNADDAGAKRIHFLYDERLNADATTGLIDVNMAQCQGPAFWAYNDAKFTDADFKSIIKLGGATKQSSKTKIGKFGLGFCAVYNLTDVPSFVSGQSLCIFDPHTTHLGKAIRDKSSPGIRLTFNEKSAVMLKRMRNQFLPYNQVFGCDLSGSVIPPSFDGTLFRLPLRTKSQAHESAIKSVPYCEDDMVKLLTLLQDSAGDLLTFTQNVSEIKLFHLPKTCTNPNECKLMFSAEKEIIQTHSECIRDVTTMSVVEAMHNALVEKRHFTHSELVSVTMNMNKNEPLGASAPHLCTSSWLVSWASGSGRIILDKTIDLENEGALPLGSVAVPLKGHQFPLAPMPFPLQKKLPGYYNSSHFFCFLPLPVECGTPVHINGCFSVSSDRKSLVKKSCDEKEETERQAWNKLLLSDAVCNAYILLLHSLEHFGVTHDDEYFHLWPLSTGENDDAMPLADAFCKAVVETKNKVFYTPSGRRAAFRDCVFLDSCLRYDKHIGQDAFDTFEKFYDSGSVVMDMPEVLHRRLHTAQCQQELAQQTMTARHFFEQIVFPNIHRIDVTQRESLVLFLLETKTLDLMYLLKSNACIPTLPDGQLRMPKELVRPQSEVSKLFCTLDGRFPSDQFCSEPILDVLVHLGMMDERLPDDIVIERARSIKTLTDSVEALNRCRKLLTYLEKRNASCEVIGDLKNIAFLPSLERPEDWPLAWTNISIEDDRVQFCSPNQLFFPAKMELIACTRLILNMKVLDDVRKNREGVLQKLGVQNEVSTSDVEAQLMAISDVNMTVLSDQEKNRLHQVCFRVYEYVESRSFDFGNNFRENNFRDLPIVLMSDKLIPPRRATFQLLYGINCEPEIYQLSSDVTKFKRFLLRIGAKETLSKEDVISVFEKRHDSNEGPLSNDDVLLTVRLLELLAVVCSHANEGCSEDELNRLYIPDDKGFLRLPCDLCIDDGYPLKRQNYMHFVNMKVSAEIHKLLKIESKRVKHLKRIKGSVAFGQSEKLVTRLKNILEGYPCDHTILYELLQNADDAGAKEIMFIQDMRQHNTETGIFDETWSDIQGPALCVFNDTCFSQADLDGICRLGEGTKSEDPTKTGQFGVGFNAVYHLTDAPSFITRGSATPNQGTFCVFDPHCAYCPAADDSNPGLQIPDLEELEQTYPGVYECYLQTELPSSEGTLFRFPLRNSKMAKSSQICRNQMDSKRLQGLLDDFRENMKKCLLFLRNVRKISLCETDQNGHIQINHVAEAFLGKEDEDKLTTFSTKCDELTASLLDKSLQLQTLPKQDIVLTMTISTCLHKTEHWIVAQTYGLDGDTQVPECVGSAFASGDIRLAPKGGVALPLLSSGTDCDLDAIGKSDHEIHRRHSSNTVDKMSGTTGQAFCFLPLPLSTGLPVHINGHFSLLQTRRALWDDTSHRGNWNSLLLEKVIPNSYIMAIEFRRAILDKAVTSSDDHVEGLFDEYHHAFPHYTQGKTDLVKNMITAFFVKLYEDESAVFPVLSPIGNPIWWVALQQIDHEFPAYFDDLSQKYLQKAETECSQRRQRDGLQTDIQQMERQLEQAKQDGIALSCTLKSIGMKLLESPLWIHGSITEAFGHIVKLRLPSGYDVSDEKLEDNILKPNTLIDFVKSGNSTAPAVCLLQSMDVPVRATPIESVDSVNRILEYCLQDDTKFVLNMDGMPLLVTNDEILRRFSTDKPVFLSLFCNLLLGSREKFVHRDAAELLSRIQGSSQSVKHLDLRSFANLLPESFDESLLSSNHPIEWDSEILSITWMKDFWRYLDTLEHTALEPLGNWCLIPGQLRRTEKGSNHTDVLVPCNRGYILLNSWTFSEEGRRNVILSLQIPAPHSKVRGTKTLQRVIASEQNPVHVLKCLQYHKDDWKPLDTQQCNELLLYINEKLGKISSSTRMAEIVRSLPLFTTVYGTLVELRIDSYIFTLKDHRNLPLDGIEKWSIACSYTLLVENVFVQTLMSYLLGDARTISITNLYCYHIFPRFTHLEQEHHLHHLRFVRDTCMHGYGKHVYLDCLVDALRVLPFIYHCDVYRRASDFYSPHNSLCKKLCDRSILPPSPFDQHEWKRFMVCAGMKESVSGGMYLQFAERIEQEGLRGVSEKIKEQADEMVRYLFCTDALLNDRCLLNKLKDICFVVPYTVRREYEQIYTQNQSQCLIKFSGSVIRKHAELVWTTTPILDHLPPCEHLQLQQIGRDLGIHQYPPLLSVVSHIQNVCSAIKTRLREKTNGSKNTDRCPSDNSITDLVIQFYSHLQRDGIGNADAKRMLSETPIVHVKGKDLCVKAKQVVMKTDEPIPPYLVEMPIHYGQFVELFKFLGMPEYATLHQYSDVLQYIKSEIGTQVMGPEKLGDVLSAVKGLLKNLEDEGKEQIELSMNEVDTLYLPASDKTLGKSTDMVYPDKVKLKTRVLKGTRHGLVLVHSLKECQQKEAILKLPDRLLPKILSIIIEERLISPATDRVPDSKVDTLQHFLSSAPVLNAIKKIGKLNEEEVVKCRQRIVSISFVTLSTIETILRLDRRDISGTEMKQECYSVEENGFIWFYIQSNEYGVRNWLKKIGQKLYTMLSQCAGGKISPEKFRELVDYMDDPDGFKSYCEEFLDEEECEADESMSYHPGQLVPLRLYPLLQNAIARLEIGDLVAYETLDPLIDECPGYEGEDPVYTFVRIRSDIPLNGQDAILQMYCVDMGQGETKEVMGIRLYKVVYEEADTSTDLVLHQHGHEGATPLNRDKIFDEIIQTLSSAWNMNVADRKRVMKRLLLIWHPDKNKGKGDTYERFSTEVTQFIFDIVRRLENGERFDTSTNTTDGSSSRPRRRDYDNWSYTTDTSGCRTFGGRMSSRHSRYYAYFRDSNVHRKPQEHIPNPQPGEAKRWFKQASMDFKCACNSMQINKTVDDADETKDDYNWICFKFHQACEKACKALVYSIDADVIYKLLRKSHNLPYIVQHIGKVENLIVLLREVEGIIGSYSRMRYPDMVDYPKVPGELYTQSQTDRLAQLTEKVLDEIDKKM